MALQSRDSARGGISETANSTRILHVLCGLGIAVLALGPVSTPLAAQTETVIYSFPGGATGLYSPFAGLVMDTTGALYGAASSGGQMGDGGVFKLAPPAEKGGSWTETSIYSSASPAEGEGFFDAGFLVLDKTGSLYGTVRWDGTRGFGAVFQLTPPASGDTWTETGLYNFGSGSDAQNPYAGLIAAGGALYGTTQWGGSSGEGAVFRLTPPAQAGGAWSETVLYSFTGGNDGGEPLASPTAHDGKLYGTTLNGGAGGNGVVYQLSPPAKGSTVWTETVLHAFPANFTNDGSSPQGALIFDKQGALYGTTPQTYGAVNYGMVFKLTPPDWEETILYAFTGGNDGEYPAGSLILDAKGSLYGTTAGYPYGNQTGANEGSVFRLTPPAVAGGAWTETTLHTFTGGSDGGIPTDGLLLKGDALYGTTTSGGPDAQCGCGVVFEITP